MAKRMSYFFYIMLLILSLTACSSSAGSKTNETGNQNITQFGAPERKYDIQGQVKSIRGNEITVYKMVGEQLELTEEEKEKRRQERQNLSQEEKQQLKEERTNSSNETQAFIVPVGAPIVAAQNAGGNSELKKIDLADIQKGSLLKIWFKSDSNNGEAEFIQIMNSGGI